MPILHREEGQQAAGNLLRAWFESGSETQARPILAELFEQYLQPWCETATQRSLRAFSRYGVDRAEQAAEIQSEVLLDMATRLREIRAEKTPLRDLRAYLVTCVYNACFSRLRHRSPKRVQLQNRVRYLLRHDARFALWTSGDGELLCGLAKWKGRDDYVPPAQPELKSRDLAELLESTLLSTGRPSLLNEMVGTLAEVLGVADFAPVSLAGREDTVSVAPTLERALSDRQSLAAGWKEIRDLPENQRAALLLNLRDDEGNGVIELIPGTGLASFRELAETLGMSAAELAEVWNDLPLDDNRIADLLGLTRQQVINLRKSARARLARRFAQGGW